MSLTKAEINVNGSAYINENLDNQFFGFDALKGEYVDDMVKAGIVDPTKVVKVALENAVSIASSVLRSSVLITENPKKEDKK